MSVNWTLLENDEKKTKKSRNKTQIMKIDKKINEFQLIEENGKRMNFQIPMDKSRNHFRIPK